MTPSTRLAGEIRSKSSLFLSERREAKLLFFVLKSMSQAGDDTAQITDFAQTWYKFWVWWVNDCCKKVGRNILFPSS